VPDTPTIIVQQNQRNDGCFSGCGGAFAVLLLIGLAVEYWYIAAGLAVVGVLAVAWYVNTRSEPPSLPRAPDSATASAGAGAVSGRAATCAGCGSAVTGNFCAACGAAHRRVCSGCERPGLDSAFCPDCGSATYLPPTG
jgi:hypothetical protein